MTEKSKLKPYIDSTDALKDLIIIAKDTGIVALDTEFVWERTFYPNLGIVQLSLPNGNSTIIDTTVISDISPIGELISDQNIIKILHDSTQDLTILHTLTGCFPKNIFDTQRAAGFMGLPCTISLAKLLFETVDVELAKTETRTNWLKRPLSEKQIEYALDDVKYLCQVREIILNKIKTSTVSRWLEMEMTDLNNETLYRKKDPRKAFLRIKGRNRLRPKGLATLRELATWRESVARTENLPREHVITDKDLLTIAKIDRYSEQNLLKNSELSNRKVYRYIKDILKVCSKKINPNDYPKQPPRIGKSASIKIKNITSKVITKIKERSASAGIDHALVFSKSKVESLVRDSGKTDIVGWRNEIIGDLIKEVTRLN